MKKHGFKFDQGKLTEGDEDGTKSGVNTPKKKAAAKAPTPSKKRKTAKVEEEDENEDSVVADDVLGTRVKKETWLDDDVNDTGGIIGEDGPGGTE